MRWLQRLRLVGRTLLRRGRVDAELDEEFRFHIDHLAGEFQAEGLSPESARRAALRTMGGVEAHKEYCRETRGTFWLDALRRDVSHAWRVMRRNPGITVIALLLLAIGIGANTAVFCLARTVVMTPLPYRDADRIVALYERTPRGDRAALSTLNFMDWRRRNDVFSDVAALTSAPVVLTGAGDPVQLRGVRVSPRYFHVFAVPPLLGRVFDDADGQTGADHVAILSHALWASRFGADPQLIGRAILLDDTSYTVIGVVPDGRGFDRSWEQLWLPLTFTDASTTRDFHWLSAFALMRPGVTVDRARADMDILSQALSLDYPASNRNWGVIVEPYRDLLVNHQTRGSVLLVSFACAAILLLCCSNLASIMLARGLARSREFAARFALGATPGAIARQIVTEHVVLSISGGLFGIAVAYALMALLKQVLPAFAAPGSNLPPVNGLAIDGTALTLSLALAIGTGLLIGVVPAVRVSRSPIADAIKDGGRGSTDGRAQLTFRALLVVFQIALTCALLTSAGLLVRGFDRLQHVETGFDPAGVLTATLPLSNREYGAPVVRTAYLNQLIDTVASIPGVQAAALTSALPMRGIGLGLPFQILDRNASVQQGTQSCFFKVVTPDYFRTLSLPLHRGRPLTKDDREASARVAVINDTMVRKYFRNVSPVGQHVLLRQVAPGTRTLGNLVEWEVVGVVADERVTALDDVREHPGMYVTSMQAPMTAVGIVLKGDDPKRLGPALTSAVASLNGRQPLTDVKALADIRSESLTPQRLQTVILVFFAGMALSVAALGVYGVLSYAVQQRSVEIAIRMALGATSTEVVFMVVRRAMTMAATGLFCGLLTSLAVNRALSAFLPDFDSYSGTAFAVVAGTVVVVSLAACVVPVRRATRINPIVAMRAS